MKRNYLVSLLSCVVIAGTMGNAEIPMAETGQAVQTSEAQTASSSDAKEKVENSTAVQEADEEKTVRESLDLLKNNMEKLIAENADLKQQNVTLRADNILLKTDAADMNRELEELRGKIEELEAEKTAWEEEKKSLTEKGTALEEENRTLSEAESALREENKILAEAETALEGENKALTEAGTALEKEKKALETQKAELENEKAELEKKLAELETGSRSAVDAAQDTAKTQEAEGDKTPDSETVPAEADEQQTADSIKNQEQDQNPELSEANVKADETGESTESPTQEGQSGEEETPEGNQEASGEDLSDLVSMEPYSSSAGKQKEPVSVLNDPSFDRIYIGTDQIVSVQIALNESGYACGTVDGVLGRTTSEQIAAYQRDHGMEETGGLTDELVEDLLGITPPGEADVIKSTEESNVPLADADILTFTLEDLGREENAYHVGVSLSCKVPATISYVKFNVSYYDQNSRKLAEDEQRVVQTIPYGQVVQADSWLEGDQASWDVAAAGVSSYEYRLTQADDYGFNDYVIDLQTGLVKGSRV